MICTPDGSAELCGQARKLCGLDFRCPVIVSAMVSVYVGDSTAGTLVVPPAKIACCRWLAYNSRCATGYLIRYSTLFPQFLFLTNLFQTEDLQSLMSLPASSSSASLPSASSLIRAVYSPETFRAASAIWQKKLSDHLQQVVSGEGVVLNWTEPEQAISAARRFMDQGISTDGLDGILKRFSALLDQTLRSGQNLHHPHYIGHQVPASVPLAGLFDAIGAITNQVMAIYEMGPWSTAVEYALIDRLSQKIGWDPRDSTGLLTHGGSLANLTALLTARNVSLPGSWENGLPDNAVLIAHTDAHYCVTRSAGILGLGSRQVLKVPLDDQRRMNADTLRQILKTAIADGRKPIAVSCCACATPTGAFDRLNEIADLCEHFDVWMHVDAAHGGAALMSRKHRHLLDGIHRADSVVWDAHKMLFVPALCAAVLYKKRDVRFETFRQSAPYLFDPSAPGMADYDSGMRTIECTKRATGFALWGLWSVVGEEIFEQLVDHVFNMAHYFWQQLNDAPDFEALHQPECNIVAFRHLPKSVADSDVEVQNRFQRELRTRLIRSGSFYIVQTQLNHLAALRVVLMNPLTTTTDMAELLDEIRRIGIEVASTL